MIHLLSQGDAMWQALITLAGASPAAVAVIIVVVIFLRHIQCGKREDREYRETQSETMKELVNDCKLVIKDNTQAMKENTAALARVGK